MNFSTACRTDVGRVRTNNEDNFVEDAAQGLFVVCDGMGGHNAGEVASHLAGQSIAQSLAKAAAVAERFASFADIDSLLAMQTAMRDAVAYANHRIFTQSQDDAQHHGMGTTCTAVALLAHNKAVLGHVGDSRLYLLRGSHLMQLTEDHTYVTELVQRGAITPKQALEHPQSNVLSRAMGVQAEVASQAWLFDIDPGDTLLLCSDGVYNYFPADSGLATLMGTEHLAEGLSAIIDTALRRGGHDNCTGILLRMHDDATPTPQRLPHSVAQLGQGPLFARLTPTQQLGVLGMGQRQTLAAGAQLMAAGAMMEGMVLVVTGILQVRRGDELVRTITPGQTIGQFALLGPMLQPDRVVAASQALVWHISHRAFGHFVRQDPRVGSILMASMLQMIGASTA